MNVSPCLNDVISALSVQTGLCLKQLSDVELRIAEWQTNGCSPKDFPLDDYQKIDVIKQRLSDIISVLGCQTMTANADLSEIAIDWSKLEPHVCLGETKSAILTGTQVLHETQTREGEFVFF